MHKGFCRRGDGKKCLQVLQMQTRIPAPDFLFFIDVLFMNEFGCGSRFIYVRLTCKQLTNVNIVNTC